MPTHVIKSRVGKLKTRVGKLKKNFRRFAPNFLSKNVCPPWPETVPAPLAEAFMSASSNHFAILFLAKVLRMKTCYDFRFLAAVS